MSDPPSSLRARHSEETRSLLISAARRLFAERGYHNVGVREFAAAAGVTRGALYHYFADKEALFLAVYDAVQRDLMQEAARRHRDPARPDRWTQLRQDLQLALDLARDQEFQRIKLVDGPAVMGWTRWREVERQFGLGAVMKAVERSMAEGLIPACPAEPLSLMIWSSFN